MNWIEILVVTLGLSLDIFAVVECQGALVVQVKKRQLISICALISVWQMAALYIGSFLAELLCRYDLREDSLVTGRIISSVIFVSLGLRMCAKAWKNDRVDERRIEELNIRKLFQLTVVASIYTILTGIAFGFLDCHLWTILLMIVAFTIAVVILGVYTGYRFGFEQKTKAYAIGGALLILGGIDVVVRYIFLT